MKAIALYGSSSPRLIGRLLLAALVVAAALATACAAQNSGKTHPVKIFYVEACPDKTNKPDLVEVYRGDRVKWQSVVKDGSGTKDVVREYSILFDPFVGSSIKSDGNGTARSKPIHPETAQDVVYKYTVVSLDDPAEGSPCDPLDPRIRVRK